MITIAIVEDEEAYAKQLTEYIEKYQQESGKRFKVIRFRDGDEIVEKYTGEYDIILMDIQMQFMDGMTAAEEIRKLDTKVVIMFITNMTNYAIRQPEDRLRSIHRRELSVWMPEGSIISKVKDTI